MPRWQPDAALRLMRAALELFAEKGYDNTTIIEIAERAGVTKSTFFRHFPDKREVLFGGDTFGRVMAEAIGAAPPTAGAMEAVVSAIESVGSQAFTADRRQTSRARRSVIASNPELQEREALKGLRTSAAMSEALRARGVPETTADLAAEMGALVLRTAYERWSGARDGVDFVESARQALNELRTASESLRWTGRPDPRSVPDEG